MRRVIVNSTPIIVLCNIGLLDILKALYAEIYIPEAVYREAVSYTHLHMMLQKRFRKYIRRNWKETAVIWIWFRYYHLYALKQRQG